MNDNTIITPYYGIRKKRLKAARIMAVFAALITALSMGIVVCYLTA